MDVNKLIVKTLLTLNRYGEAVAFLAPKIEQSTIELGETLIIGELWLLLGDVYVSARNWTDAASTYLKALSIYRQLSLTVA